MKSQVKTKRDAKAVAKEIADIRKEWLKDWEPRLKSDEAPLSPYRVINDLAQHGRRGEHHHHP